MQSRAHAKPGFLLLYDSLPCVAVVKCSCSIILGLSALARLDHYFYDTCMYVYVYIYIYISVRLRAIIVMQIARALIPIKLAFICSCTRFLRMLHTRRRERWAFSSIGCHFAFLHMYMLVAPCAAVMCMCALARTRALLAIVITRLIRTSC